MLTRYRGILVVVGAVGIVWLGSLLQLFRAPDGWVYDLAVRVGAWHDPGVPSVLMVETDPRSELSAEDGLQILDYLQRLGARQIIFPTLPSTFDERFHRRARDYGRLIVGQVAATDPWLLDAPDHPPRTTPASHHIQPGLPSGDLSLPLAESGVHRYGATMLRTGESEIPSLAMVAAWNLGRQPPKGDFRVNFNRGPDWIPRVSVERVLGNGLIPELVLGRSVLIGPQLAAAAPGLYTPVNASGSGMSLLEFQAYAIDTLSQHSQIRDVPWIVNLLLLGLIGLINLIVYQWVHLDRSSWFTISLVAAYLVSGWLLLHGLRIWIPVVEIALAQVLMFWLFVRLKLLRDDEEMRHTVLRRMAHLQDYMLPPDFYQLDEHWAQVITFVDQTLNLNRVIFLEKVEGDHRVREVQALRCSLDDIDERRRDFERFPYSDAITEGGPIRLESRLFFSSDVDSSFEQYLVPLLFGGEVQGFWALEVAPREIDSSENFRGNIRNFGNQIAELLYHRHRWQEQRNSESGIFRRFFRLEAVKASSQEVVELLDQLDNRLQAVQAVFDGLATASVQYDLFGRVVQLNESMELFMRRQDISGYRLTALDLLVELSGMTQAQARRMLQQVVVDRREFYTPVKRQGGKGENYSVHLRPLTATESERDIVESSSPFEMAGILFEVSDERSLKKRYESKEQLLEWLRLRVRGELRALLEDDGVKQQLLVAAGSDLQSQIGLDNAVGMEDEVPYLPVAGSAATVGGRPFYERVTEVLATLERIQGVLAMDWGDMASSTRLVDVYPLLTETVEELRSAAADKRVALNIDIPRLMGLVNTQPDQLAQLFRAVLQALLADAVAGSELTVGITESDGALLVAFDNTGFGIPDEHLQAYLWQPEHGVTEEFKDLQQAVQPVADWGGDIQLNSEVGVGIQARLRLQVES